MCFLKTKKISCSTLISFYLISVHCKPRVTDLRVIYKCISFAVLFLHQFVCICIHMYFFIHMSYFINKLSTRLLYDNKPSRYYSVKINNFFLTPPPCLPYFEVCSQPRYWWPLGTAASNIHLFNYFLPATVILSIYLSFYPPSIHLSIQLIYL